MKPAAIFKICKPLRKLLAWRSMCPYCICGVLTRAVDIGQYDQEPSKLNMKHGWEPTEYTAPTALTCSDISRGHGYPRRGSMFHGNILRTKQHSRLGRNWISVWAYLIPIGGLRGVVLGRAASSRLARKAVPANLRTRGGHNV